MVRLRPLLVVSLTLLSLAAIPAHAALIQGILTVGGSIHIASSTDIDFFPPLGGGSGDITVGGGLSGDFAGLTGSTGTILDMTDPPDTVISVPGFLLITATTFTFELTFIDLGIFPDTDCATLPAVAGQLCTPTGTQFNLVNTSATSSVAFFTIRGFASDGSGDPPSPFTGVIESTFAAESYQDVLADFAAAGFIESAFSGSFTVTAIPEPSTFFLIGGGALLAGFLRRYKQRSS